MSDQVQGYCPRGCGKTLFLGSGGYVTCSWIACPEPDAVSTILEDQESEHIVQFTDAGFTVRHPLRERVGDQLMECDLDNFLWNLDGPPVKPGKFRAFGIEGKWRFQSVSS